MTASPAPDDPTVLAHSGRLDVVARTIVEGLRLGQHRSPRKGVSVDFVEHRPYVPGDDVRHIDWRAWGKTGRYYVKQFEEETNLVAWFVLDTSGSMAYRGKTLSKFDYARQLTAALACLLLAQRDAVGLIAGSKTRIDRLPAASSQSQFERMVERLTASSAAGESDLARALTDLTSSLTRPRLIFLVTDALEPIPPFAEALKQAAAAGHDLNLLRIVAPEEVDFPFQKGTEFRDLEQASHRVQVDPYRLSGLYRANYQRHAAELLAACRSYGVEELTLRTDRSYREAISEFLEARQRRLGLRGR